MVESRDMPGKVFAAKVIKKNDSINPSSEILAYQEIEVLKSFHHENILKFHEAYEGKDHIYIVTEYYEAPSLLDAIAIKESSEQNFKESELKYIFQ